MLTEFRIAPALTLEQAFAGWLDQDYRKKGNGQLAKKSIEAYQQDLRHFTTWFEAANGQGFAIELMSRQIVREYFDWQIAAKAAVNSRNRRLASLRVLVHFCRETGLLDYDPTDRIERGRRVNQPPRSKDEAEYGALTDISASGAYLKRHTARWELLGARDRVIIGLMARAGLRIAEVAGLDISDLRMDVDEIHVIGKGGVEADIQIPSELTQEIRSWLAIRPGHGSALITDWHGQRITTGQIRRRLMQVGQAAGVSVKPHDLRHTCAYRLLDVFLRQGMHVPAALDAVRMQLRHSDVRTTMMYLRARRSQVREAMEAL